MQTPPNIIAQTKSWILKVVVGCNFCPFAAREIKKGSVHYEIIRPASKKASLEALALEFGRLDFDCTIETSFLIFPETFADFNSYLGFVEMCESLLLKINYRGIYQLASFHPLYLFAGASPDDAANYTNRSPFPMIQILREESITLALRSYLHPEKIPARNIEYAKEKGLVYMRALRESCLFDEG